MTRIKKQQPKTLIALVVLCLFASACGSTSDGALDAGAEAQSDETTEVGDDAEDMDDMDHSNDDMDGMAMGDADATPASEVVGADITKASFALLDSSPEGFEQLDGVATIARYEGTTITIEFTGLQPGLDYISHLHAGSCDESGGPHFKFDPDGADAPPNEIHLTFTSTPEGLGFMTAENDMAVADEGQSVVVHLAGQMSDKIACAQL